MSEDELKHRLKFLDAICIIILAIVALLFIGNVVTYIQLSELKQPCTEAR